MLMSQSSVMSLPLWSVTVAVAGSPAATGLSLRVRSMAVTLPELVTTLAEFAREAYEQA